MNEPTKPDDPTGNPQSDLFAKTPDQLRDEGIARVLENEDDSGEVGDDFSEVGEGFNPQAAFLTAFTRCVLSGRPFMGEDVRMAMPETFKPHSPNW